MVQPSFTDVLVSEILVSITLYISKYLDYKNIIRSNRVAILQDGKRRDKKKKKN